MRRFSILRDGAEVGFGVEWLHEGKPFVAYCIDGQPSRMSDKWIARDDLERRYIDPQNDDRLTNPPAGWTYGGAPVYSARNPPPPEGEEQKAGKLVSEQVEALVREDARITKWAQSREQTQAEALICTVDAIVKVLDERLGRE